MTTAREFVKLNVNKMGANIVKKRNIVKYL